jgi:hypothetical protein
VITGVPLAVSGRGKSRFAGWCTLGESDPAPDPAVQAANWRAVLVDNLSHLFNLLIHKGCSDSLNQIARQMVYILR